jgi:hypothetical protein
LANWEKDPGATGATGLVCASGPDIGSNRVANEKPAIRKNSDQATIIVFLIAVLFSCMVASSNL